MTTCLLEGSDTPLLIELNESAERVVDETFKLEPSVDETLGLAFSLKQFVKMAQTNTMAENNFTFFMFDNLI